ncbi:TetR family transcriptional regulator C-terminal domain-containing protein [Defluviimonas sp. WL0024]|uniref:TetR family transcriptional regulator C-terminal domain-containing protein n=2 Tax=Albidovulum TaxID=205889 RepID=A0ABT3J4X6_9RHOB|nr:MULTISPECIES: TetR family transcriptional regulator C-terminal domain-containing protein [Defluviimonas]MCU9849151.1 TetR family transcriptional regulator C-terminal domain-containing protein [Defluviimonas sp. WL0024]MCW3782723.1 TetR family transcriptional regulator C-terminal domain-containing protein [Defluviimonas salinarum]
MTEIESSTTDQQPQPRKLSREARREQLIEATIETIGRQGYAKTTLTDVSRHAGLSHGLVNFHFETKEKLLAETLSYLAEEYRRNWTTALEAAGSDPARRLDAIFRADFNPTICTPSRLAAWCAFWGEAQSRPLYQEQCGSNDREYNRVLEEICRELLAETGRPGDPVRIARVLRVTTEGVWMDLMTMSAPYDKEEALCTVFTCAAAFFPEKFTSQGAVSSGSAGYSPQAGPV